MDINERYFLDVTKLVIQKLEGGYFHPDMRTNNPAKFGAYHRSGETMYGLDRWAGHDLYYKTPRKAKSVIADLHYIYSNAYEYKRPEAREFWQTIDKANARKNWPWLYMGGKYEPRLKELAAKILLPQFNKLADRYLTEESQKLIVKDPRLLFHFIYAVWNGSGWFQRFANAFNKEVKAGKRGNALFNAALNSRTQSSNELIRKGGNKIKGFINTIDLPKPTAEAGLNSPLLIIPLLLLAGYYLIKQ